MTIQEAIQSGKWFRRSGEQNWIWLYPNAQMLSHALCYESSDQTRRLTVEDLLATDWEVKP